MMGRKVLKLTTCIYFIQKIHQLWNMYKYYIKYNVYYM